MKITIKEAINIAIREAKNYKAKLANTYLLILYRDRIDNQLKCLEIEFRPHHYQHLTGLVMIKRDEKTGQIVKRENTALEFYHRCIEKPYITEKEIRFKNPQTIDLKMLALPYITQITKITKMTGEYNEIKENLAADIIVGGVDSCIGISKNDNNEIYFPRTCLKENIKNITKYTSQVLAIFQKPINSTDKYKDIKYVAKGIDLSELKLTEDIESRISLEKYIKPVKLLREERS